MNKKQTKKSVFRVLLSILLVMAVLTFTVSTALSLIFSVSRVDFRLLETGFYGSAVEEIENEIHALQSVIDIPSEKVFAILSPDEIQEMLAPYTSAITRQFLAGGKSPQKIEYLSDELYQLVCDTITEEHYGGDIEQLTADRLDAYEELVAVVTGTLNFFPQSILNKLFSQSTSTKLAPVYRAIALVGQLRFPALILFVLCVAGLLWLHRKNMIAGLRKMAGTCFITASVLFVPTVFVYLYSLPERLSLADGLLRQYLLTLYTYMTGSLLNVTLWVFAITLVLLIVTVIFSAKYAPKSCNDRSNVLK